MLVLNIKIKLVDFILIMLFCKDPANAQKYQTAKYNKYIGIFWECLGALWHGHELIGIENFPESGPALLIIYHPAMPVDLFYVDAKVFLYKNRKIRYVGDQFVNKVPGKLAHLNSKMKFFHR
jgi:hypothetical protein